MLSHLDLKLLRDLKWMKAQVITISLVVACGIAVLVGMRSTYESLMLAQNSFYDQSRFAHLFAVVKRAPNTMIARLEQLDGVMHVEHRITFDTLIDLPGRSDPAVGRFISLNKGQQSELNRLHLLRGRWPLATRGDEALVGEAFFKANGFKLNQEISAMFNGRYRSVRIVGVVVSPEYIYSIIGSSPMPDDEHFGVFWIPRPTLAAAFDMVGAFNSVSFRVNRSASSAKLIKQIDKQLETYGGVGAYARKDQSSHLFLSEEIKGLNVQASFIPIIFLSVATFLLNVVIGRIISSQREQIATLKAMGFSNWHIALHFLKMTVLIVLLGSSMGILGGQWLATSMTELYTQYFRFPILTQVMPRYLPLASVSLALLAAFVGVFSGLHKVFKLTPAEAMQPPTPTKHRKGILERMGLGHFISNEGRMIYRGLGSRPMRSMLTSVGMSFALMIVVLGMFWTDSVDYLMMVQFGLVQKEDVSIGFTKNLPLQVQNDLLSIPGVMQAEGYRMVPIRLVKEQNTETTALVGLPDQPQLKAVLDKNLRDIPISEHTFSIGATLARKLDLKEGDSVNIEILEGQRKKTTITIGAIVDEFLGGSTYTSLNTVSELLKEAPSINMANIKIDDQVSHRLYTDLKQFPFVSSVTFKDTAIKMFNETSATYMLVFALILTMFSMVIAFGIVYNSARIALAERSWELASLRVLGFSSAEVFRILMGELIILLATAIPIGWALGYYATKGLLAMITPDAMQMPFKIDQSTFTLSALVLIVSGIISALVIWGRVRKLDFNAALKARG